MGLRFEPTSYAALTMLKPQIPSRTSSPVGCSILAHLLLAHEQIKRNAEGYLRNQGRFLYVTTHGNFVWRSAMPKTPTRVRRRRNVVRARCKHVCARCIVSTAQQPFCTEIDYMPGGTESIIQPTYPTAPTATADPLDKGRLLHRMQAVSPFRHVEPWLHVGSQESGVGVPVGALRQRRNVNFSAERVTAIPAPGMFIDTGSSCTLAQADLRPEDISAIIKQDRSHQRAARTDEPYFQHHRSLGKAIVIDSSYPGAPAS